MKFLSPLRYVLLGLFAASLTCSAFGQNLPPTVSFLSPTNGMVFISPADITLTAKASDPEGRLSRVLFYKGSTLIREDWTSPYSISLTKLTNGTYSFMAKAIDNKGASASSQISVRVKSPNVLPAVTLISPKGSTVVAPATVPLTAFSSDEDGSITKVEFFRGSTRILTDTAAPYKVTVSNVLAGTHSFTAKAYDNEGAVNTSFAFTLTCKSSSSVSPSGQLVLVTNGVAKAVIVKENTSTNVATAASALQSTIQKSTGVNLNIVVAGSTIPSGMVAVRIGEGPTARNAGIRSSYLTYGQYRIKTLGSDILIVGRDTSNFSGTVWGVEHIMDHYMKVRWLWPGTLGMVAPKLTSVAVPPIDFTWTPLGEQRQLATRFGSLSTTIEPKALLTIAEQNKVEAEADEWLHHHRMGSTKVVIAAHSFGDWWTKYRFTHPEYFAKPPAGKSNPYNGREDWVKLCNSKAGVIQQIVNDYTAAGAPDDWQAGPNDAAGYCTCVDCLAMDEVSGTRDLLNVWNGKEPLTIRHVKWWKRILAELRKLNPRVKLGVTAYGAYRNAPPAVHALSADFLISNMSASAPEMYANWLGWAAGGARQSLRPNWWHSGTYAPYLTHKEEGDFTRFAIKNGMWAFRQDELKGSFGTQALRYYTFARLTVRPELTVDQITDEFISGFGSASLQIREYIAYWESYSRRAAYPWLAGGAIARPDPSLYNYYVSLKQLIPSALGGSFKALYLIYTDPVMAKGYEILDRATLAAANDSQEVRDRILFLRDGLRHAQQAGKTIKLGYDMQTNPTLETQFLAEYGKLRTMRRSFTFRHITWGDNDFKSEKSRSIPSYPQ
jgi:hypothetical protein